MTKREEAGKPQLGQAFLPAQFGAKELRLGVQDSGAAEAPSERPNFSLFAVNAVGRGARFVVTLPRCGQAST